MEKRIVTGIKPTGIVHIGNYFGAIKPAIDLSKVENNLCFYFIADNHALNILNSAQELKNNTLHVASAWLACGLNPNNVIFYRQSDVQEIFHLNWILSNVTPKGLLNRAHGYKSMVDNNLQNGEDKDFGVNMGLFNYPVLMAADILLFNADFVPVGQDQKQHIEIARDIATYFNNKFEPTFKLPEGLIDKNVCTILGLDGRKMSKSYNNTIQLFCDEKTLNSAIKKIVTDSTPVGEPKNTDCTIAELYKLFAKTEEYENFLQDLKSGIGWGVAKQKLFEVMNNYIAPMREKYNYYISNPSVVQEMLANGAKKAHKYIEQTYETVLKNIGIL